MDSFLLVLALFFSLLDATLTVRQVSLYEQKGIDGTKIEINPIARKLLRMAKENRSLVLFLYSSIIIILIYWLNQDKIMYLLLGALFVVNVNHYYNLKHIKSLWRNKAYWKLVK